LEKCACARIGDEEAENKKLEENLIGFRLPWGIERLL
jgi:hypothetical protein